MDSIKSNQELIAEVDVTSRERIACLSARGLTKHAIADIVLLSVEHIDAVQTTDEYKRKYASEADRIIQEQIDRDEGWDGLETRALEMLLESMRFNRDPKFALQTAMIANRAERRAKTKKPDPTVIDAAGARGGNNVIILSVNKNFIASQQNNSINIAQSPDKIPLKQSDMPAPKLVDEILAPAKERALLGKPKEETELERMFREAGVIFDKDE